MFKTINCYLVFSLIIANSLYSQKPRPFDRELILQNNPELKKLSYASRTKKLELSLKAKQLLEAKGFKVLGQNQEIFSPREDTLSSDSQLIKIDVKLDLRSANYNSIYMRPQYKMNIFNTDIDTIMTDDFEGDFPGTEWQRSGDPSWGKTNYKDHTGSYSIWCAKDGTKGVEPGSGYPNICQSMIIYGPFDLSKANYAQLRFWYLLDTEYEKDWFFYMASTDGNNFQGIGMSGESRNWDEGMLHLNNLIDLGDITGRSQVWVAFIFESDNSSTADNGVYVDDVELTKRQVNGTPLAGTVSGKFTASSNPYIAVSDFGIAEGDTLEIKPGVEIRFESETAFIVQGSLKAIGTPSDSIIFTSNQEIPKPGDWDGVILSGPDSSIIKYCVIEYGGQSIISRFVGRCGVLFLNNSFDFTNNLIRRNHTNGVGFLKHNSMSDCIISENKIGVRIYFTSPTLLRNLITKNTTGISLSRSTAYIIDNEIASNSGIGISGNTSDLRLIRNKIYDNGLEGVLGRGGDYWMSSSIKVIDNLIFQNKSHGLRVEGFVNSGDIQGNVIYNNKGNGLYLAPSWPKAYFNIYNNTVVNNDSCGISFLPGGAGGSRIENNIFTDNTYAGLKFNEVETFWIRYNDFFNNGINIVTDSLADLGVINMHNRNGDPCDPYYNLFLDPIFLNGLLDPYQLSSISPCINAGNPNAIYNDIDGTVNDMGSMGGSNLFVTATEINFGPLLPGMLRTQTFYFINNRDTSIVIDKFETKQPNKFSSVNAHPFVIQPFMTESDMTAIRISFHPTNRYIYNDTLNIFSDAFIGSVSAKFPLRGEGIKGTLISGEVSGNWTVTGSPYVIDKGEWIKIPYGKTLKILPGVKVLFNLYSGFDVYGKLEAIGTKVDSIIFSRFEKESFVENYTILFQNNTETSKIEYCSIKFGGRHNIIDGGAIQCDDSSPVINFNSFVSGKGIICKNNAAPIISNNIFQYNRQNQPTITIDEYWDFTGIVSCVNSSPKIISNIFTKNSYSTDPDLFNVSYLAPNSVIYCTEESSPIIKNNIISDNKISGITVSGASSPIIDNNIIKNNYRHRFGGGIFVGAHSSAIITNNVIGQNSALDHPATLENRGGGIYCIDSSILLSNNLLYENISILGGGIFCENSIINAYNNTIAKNKARNGCAIYLNGGNNVFFMNGIIWNNSDDNIDLLGDDDTITFKFSNIQGGWEGEGNIDADPLFVDPENGDLHLQPPSPCIDAGNPDPQYYDPEDPNNPGYALYPALGTILNDMGAFGGPDAAKWVITAVESKPEELPNLPKTYQLFQNYPNPFNPTTTVKYQLPKSTEVSLKIYNVLGQLVRTLVDEKQMAGNYSIIWDGKDNNGQLVASGIYMYKIHTQNFVKTKKMILIR